MMSASLLPTGGMGWEEFEDFLDALLVRLRLVPGVVPRLVDSSRYGRQGQKQDGIDHCGSYDDGTTSTWQCKEQLKLTEGNVREIIENTGVDADKHVIAFSRVADGKARREVTKWVGWSIWDGRDLGNLVRLLPVHEARTLLDAHFGAAVRRQFLPVAGTDVFLGVDEFYGPLLNEGRRFHHRADLVGRGEDLAALVDGLTCSDGPRVVVVEAPAGRGKSRLVLEVLRQVQQKQPVVPVLVRAEQRLIDSGALQELSDGPSVLLVEDAHRDPAGVVAVLQYARRTLGVRVVITSRPSGAMPVRAAALAAQFDLSEVLARSVGPLTIAAARELVTALGTPDVRIPARFAEALAQASRATPLVAVAAIAMIRRGELSTALRLNDQFRAEILSRYGQVTTEGVPGVPGDEVRSVLALVAALSPVDLDDQGLLNAMALFQGLTVLALLEVLKALTDHGVLLDRAREVRVSPDVLADEVLITRAIMLGVDTGFVAQVWQAFGTTHAAAVIRNFAELDWLIRSTASGEAATGFPDVFAGIWKDVSREVSAADSAGRSDALSQLAVVAGSQSSRVFSLVKEILAAPTADGHRDWLFGQYEVKHADVQRLAVTLLQTCAAASPVLLPEVLDELWLLAQLNSRPPNQDGNHPARIIEDLGSLGNPGSLQRAQVIISSVRRWLGTPDPAGVPRTPLFALQPLLAKEGMAQEWQPHGLGLSSYLVSVASGTPLRGEVRDLLRLVASGADLRRTVEAIGLLGGALQAPHGYFGQEVPVSAVLEWEQDDLATIAMLAGIAGRTDEPLVRLAIRENVAPHARHALSPSVRASCLALISQLDDHLEDVLTDLLISRDRQSLPPQSKRAAFTADPQAARPSPPPAAGQSAELEVQLADIDPDPLAAYEQTYKRRQRERQLVARQLWAGNEPVHVIQTLSERLTAITATAESAARGIGLLLAAIADEYPGRIVALLDTIMAAGAGPLDSWVAVLLERLRSHDQQAFLHALVGVLQARPSLAAGALRGFMTSPWASTVPEARSLLTGALDHPDREVALQALSGLGELLSTRPAAFSARLTTAAPEHPDAVRTALETASGRQPKSWVPSLRQDDRAAILAIVAALPKWDWSEETLVAALAIHLPEQVLQVLTDRGPLPVS